MIDKAEKKVSKQLDLAKFLESQQIITLALLSILNPTSRSLLKQVKTMVLHYNSNDNKDDLLFNDANSEQNMKKCEEDIKMQKYARQKLELADERLINLMLSKIYKKTAEFQVIHTNVFRK